MGMAGQEQYRPDPAVGFDDEKSVQTIAYLLRRADAPVEKMKLVKLLYLADRRSFERRGKPINFDIYYSMAHGPVLSSALNGMNHDLPSQEWEALSLADNRRDVGLAADVSEDHLSRADKAILDSIWDDFGGMTSPQIRRWTHEHCGEYVEVEDGRLPISPAEILEQVGNPAPLDAARELRALQVEMGALARLRAA
jgi:uncharacterized phage-associated protein